ncbi:MAG TPA: NAD(P)H-hydrate dehydratase [Alphaproteobacteria bacterium]|jgi:NAD(P)H-hydrate epimerase
MTRPNAASKPWPVGAAEAESAKLAALTTAEMYRADAAAMAAGVSGPRLMEAAGAAVAEQARLRWTACATLALCGPGNNGGDGFVAARLLAEAGWNVRVALLGARERLKGDAARAAGAWSGPVEALRPEALEGADLVIDAIFGAGLDRAVEGAARATIEALAARGTPVLAVDVPSGVSGDSGAVLGAAAPARVTVTFFRKKPGHLLQPGRSLCGETVVADIGIPDAVLAEIAPRTAENGPALWREALPVPKPSDHKYSRGHVVVIAGQMTGAARLAAMGAARIGAGMVTVLAPAEALAMFAALPASIIVAARPKAPALGEWLRQRKAAAVLIGPGLGRTSEARAYINACLAADRPAVLDADALTAFADHAEGLSRARRAATVLTPHAGEFARVFGSSDGDRLARIRAAAAETGAVLVAKANDTIIAAPDGRAAINANAPAFLASAGTGDVLAGMILGLVGQGMPAFDAACAAVWLHGARAGERGQNLIADDLVNAAFTFAGQIG